MLLLWATWLFLGARTDAILCSARIDAGVAYAADSGGGGERDARLLRLSTAGAGSVLRAAGKRGGLMPWWIECTICLGYVVIF